MTTKPEVRCVECDKTETLLWRTERTEGGKICQDCYEAKISKEIDKDKIELTTSNEEKTMKEKNNKIDGDNGKQINADNSSSSQLKAPMKNSPALEKRLRKSTRATRFKSKMLSNAPANATNGISSAAGSSKAQNKGARSRRNLFKRPARKTPIVQATTHYVSSVFHQGSYIQIGDIVSLVDSDFNVYYAQIRGLLVDLYCERSAFLTWLIPTQESPSPNERFDPATYLIGPDEDFSRKLSCLEFVMHAPSNYYFDRTTPFPLPDTMEHEKRPGGYIWTKLTQKPKNPVEV